MPVGGDAVISFSTAPGMISNVELALLIIMFYWWKMDNIYSLVNMQTCFADVINITHSCYASTPQCNIIKPPLVLWIYMIFPYFYGINCILLLGYIALCLPVFYIYVFGYHVE